MVLATMHDVEVIEEGAAAVVALDPVRARLLAELAEPASAAALAERVGSTRQKVNYHLRALEAQGLVTPAGERRHGGLVERLLVATAASYVVSPVALGAACPDPARATDRLGARYLISLAARVVAEVGALVRRSQTAPTFALDAAVGLPSAAARVAFADDLARAVTAVVQRHHVDGGRPHRLLVGAYPLPDQEVPT
jgi:DNA-binding transcriptional ArsR family regulator